MPTLLWDQHTCLRLSTDFCSAAVDFNNALQRSQHLFDDGYTRWGPIQWMRHPRGGNFYRVVPHAWRA